ncbi:hypothetical protein O3G_MSEX011806 [Manduca sexta]|uniref:Uncharacterized protein n=1 Tax=Manduca sexta TaxID=7130 RepID=A0A921ZLY6_MANSE|nr:hypothetical protein O3G_MSEX011806 [Manduca sexta]
MQSTWNQHHTSIKCWSPLISGRPAKRIAINTIVHNVQTITSLLRTSEYAYKREMADLMRDDLQSVVRMAHACLRRMEIQPYDARTVERLTTRYLVPSKL